MRGLAERVGGYRELGREGIGAVEERGEKER